MWIFDCPAWSKYIKVSFLSKYIPFKKKSFSLQKNRSLFWQNPVKYLRTIYWMYNSVLKIRENVH